MATPASSSANSSVSKYSKRSSASTSSACTSSVASTSVSASSKRSNGRSRRSKRSNKPRADDNDSNSDADSAIACVDDDTAGSTVAKRIAMLAKADTRTRPKDLRSEISSTTSSLLLSEGTVSIRALKRARIEAKGKERARPGDENVHEGVESTISSSSSTPLQSTKLAKQPKSSSLPKPLEATSSNIPSLSKMTPTMLISEPAIPAKSKISNTTTNALIPEPVIPANIHDSKPPCRDFQKNGTCSSEKCDKRHLLPDGTELSLDERINGKEICRTYWKTGRCNYGPRCRHRHVNTTVVTKWNDNPGQESSGASTSVSSNQAPPVTTPASSATVPYYPQPTTAIALEPVETISVSIPVKLPPTRQDQSPEVPQDKASPKEVCKRYQAGKCSKSDCPRLHPSPIPTVPAALSSSPEPTVSAKEPSPPAPPVIVTASSSPISNQYTTIPGNVCRLYLAGKCRFRICKWRHPTGPAKLAFAALLSSKVPTETETSTSAKATETSKDVASPSLSTTTTRNADKAVSEVSRSSDGSTETIQADEKKKKDAPDSETRTTASLPSTRRLNTSATASSSKSAPLSRESSLSSASFNMDSEWGSKIDEVDWSEGSWELPARVMTKEEEDYAWDNSSSADESRGPSTPPSLLRCAGIRVEDCRGEPETVQSATAPLYENEIVQPLCRKYAQGQWCPYGGSCKYRHARIWASHKGQVCMSWMRGYCPAGRSCNRLHIQNQNSIVLPPSDENDVPVTVTVFDYIQITFGTGFQIQAINTAFESGRIVVHNVPHNIDLDTLCTELRRYGTVNRAQWKTNEIGASGQTAYVIFQSKDEAARAAAALNDTMLWDNVIHVRVLTFMGSNTSLLNRKDASVRLTWDAPGRVGYAGYESRALAEATVARINGRPRGDCIMEATIYHGLPALGHTNVRFWLPAMINVEEFRAFARTHDVMLDEYNYYGLQHTNHMLHCMAGEYGPLASFKPLQPSFQTRLCRAWIEYTSAVSAARAVVGLNGLQRNTLGHTPLLAQQVYSLEYKLNDHAFELHRSDINEFATRFSSHLKLPSVVVAKKPLATFVRLQAQDAGALARIKREYERIERGDDVQDEGNTIWDDYFDSNAAKSYLQGIELAYPGIRVRVDRVRRKLTVLGPVAQRAGIVAELVTFADCLAREKTSVIPLSGNLVGLFMSSELTELQRKYGASNVVLNIAKRVLAVRGNDEVLENVRVEILKAAASYPASTPSTLQQCPACTNEVNDPVHLRCGHQWCSTCLTQYLSASTDSSIFPIACFGSDGTCTHPIPLTVARRLLPADRFDAIAHAAFRAHVHARPHEFRHCPTADCSQIYRPVPEGVILSCPACLVRICGRCSQEAHDGTPCTSKKADEQFAEWKSAHDVKACPGCHVPIEKAEGCNHMTCTQCRTHVCWTCLQTFPDGNGIYNHMREVHGGIGLAP